MSESLKDAESLHTDKAGENSYDELAKRVSKT